MSLEARSELSKDAARLELLESMAIEMPEIEGHPNRVPFRGVLTLVDAPSDKPPSGSRGHRVLLTGKAVEEAIPSLLGMAVDYTPSLDGHNARAKIGVVTSAELEALPAFTSAGARGTSAASARPGAAIEGRRLSLRQGLSGSGGRDAGEREGRTRHVVRDRGRARGRRGGSSVGGDEVHVHGSRGPAEEQGGISTNVGRDYGSRGERKVLDKASRDSRRQLGRVGPVG